MISSAIEQATWNAIGIFLAAASAASTVVGMLLQKQGLKRENKSLYRLGIFIFAVVKPVTQIAALYVAPLSLVAPLASLTILLNVVIVPYLQGMKISRVSIISGFTLSCGCVGTSLAGAHGSQSWTYIELTALGMQNWALTSFLFASLLIASLVLKLTRDDVGANGVVLVAAIPSLASALNNVMLKVLLNAVWTAPPISLLAMLVTVATTAFLQVWSTAIGVEMFDLLTFVPVQISEQILLTILYSIDFFNEELENSRGFELSSAAILAGVIMTLRHPGETSEGYIKIDEAAQVCPDSTRAERESSDEAMDLWEPGPWGRQVSNAANEGKDLWEPGPWGRQVSNPGPWVRQISNSAP